jgi:hypothetical protein
MKPARADDWLFDIKPSKRTAGDYVDYYSETRGTFRIGCLVAIPKAQRLEAMKEAHARCIPITIDQRDVRAIDFKGRQGEYMRQLLTFLKENKIPLVFDW